MCNPEEPDQIFQFFTPPSVELSHDPPPSQDALDIYQKSSTTLTTSLNTLSSSLFPEDSSPRHSPHHQAIIPAPDQASLHELSIENLLDQLSSHLVALQELLEIWFYALNLNHSKLRYWKFQHQLLLLYREVQMQHEKCPRYMSLLVDEHGRPAPSTQDALLKAEETKQLPVFRKKYDWNIQLWNPQQQHRVLALTSARITADILKLKVEELLALQEIQEYEIIDQFVHLRRTLGFESNLPKQRLAEALNLLEELLERKSERMRNSGHSHTKILLNITVSEKTNNSSEPSSDPILNKDVWCEKVKQSYWTNVFDEVSSTLGSRFECSGRDCQIQWLHHLSPHVNHKAMTLDEDKRLSELAQVYHGRHWDKVARDLNTQRTAYQCFERYQRRLNKNLIKTEWTQEEDEKLKRLVEEMGNEISGPCKWKQIALNFPRRSNLQCRARYLYTLKSNLKQGNWSPKEDILLQLLVYAYGGHRWSKIAQHFPNRTDMKCRERYEGVLHVALEKLHLHHVLLPESSNGQSIPTHSYDPNTCASNNMFVKSLMNESSHPAILDWLLLTAAQELHCPPSSSSKELPTSTELLKRFYRVIQSHLPMICQEQQSHSTLDHNPELTFFLECQRKDSLWKQLFFLHYCLQLLMQQSPMDPQETLSLNELILDILNIKKQEFGLFEHHSSNEDMKINEFESHQLDCCVKIIVRYLSTKASLTHLHD